MNEVNQSYMCGCNSNSISLRLYRLIPAVYCATVINSTQDEQFSRFNDFIFQHLNVFKRVSKLLCVYF